VPRVALSGESMSIRIVIVKESGMPPLSFSYELESDYFDSGDKNIKIEFNEDKAGERDIIVFDCIVKTAAISNMQVPLGAGSAAVTVNMGNLSTSANVPVNSEVYLCANEEVYTHMLRIRMNSLEKQISGENIPIYLAKIDYTSAGSTHVLRNVTAMPFSQQLNTGASSDSRRSGLADSELLSNVGCSVEVLKYWQKPEVNIKYDSKSKNMDFRFGLPSSEAYDYATSSGVLDVPIFGTIRVNARFTSEEITHNLGLGNVSLTFAVEYMENDYRKMMFGNGDVFAKSISKSVPKVEVAGILYPEKGTFQVGIWCHDHVEGTVLRVRWFAHKATRDTADMRSKDVVSVKIQPELHKMRVMERIHFSAVVSGSADKTVTWSVPQGDGGKIDSNGMYQAPSKAGTYEIIAASVADNDAKTSAFVIVED
jgi:hypothetical protein